MLLPQHKVYIFHEIYIFIDLQKSDRKKEFFLIICFALV